MLVLHPSFGRGVRHMMKKWTQSDLRFWKNEGSKRSMNNEKGDQQDRKSRRQLVQNASNWSNERLWWNITSTLGKITFRTKCDRDKANKIELGLKRDLTGSENAKKKGGQSRGNSLPPLSMGVSSPGFYTRWVVHIDIMPRQYPCHQILTIT